MILKPIDTPKHKYDVNLLHLMFELAKDDRMLLTFLNSIIFIREHPKITEEQTRNHASIQELISTSRK